MNIDVYQEKEVRPVYVEFFTDEKVKTISMFIAEQRKNFTENRDMIHPGYMEGFNYFFGNGFDPADFLEKLNRIGWKIRIVDGYLSGYEYFRNLNQQILPVIEYIRPIEQISYADFPDMIHDIMGHSPLLHDPNYVAFLKKVSSLVANVKLEPIDREYLALHKHTAAERKLVENELAAMEEKLKKEPTLSYRINSFALWTIEFGILNQKAPYVCYGAALAGSPLELKNIKNGNVSIHNLNSLASDTCFNFSGFQGQLFTTDALEDVLSYMKKLCAQQPEKTDDH